MASSSRKRGSSVCPNEAFTLLTVWIATEEGGGGLGTRALITGYGTDKQIGANAHYTIAKTKDYGLQTGGVAVGVYDRVELSYAYQ